MLQAARAVTRFLQKFPAHGSLWIFSLINYSGHYLSYPARPLFVCGILKLIYEHYALDIGLVDERSNRIAALEIQASNDRAHCAVETLITQIGFFHFEEVIKKSL